MTPNPAGYSVPHSTIRRFRLAFGLTVEQTLERAQISKLRYAIHAREMRPAQTHAIIRRMHP